MNFFATPPSPLILKRVIQAQGFSPLYSPLSSRFAKAFSAWQGS